MGLSAKGLVANSLTSISAQVNVGFKKMRAEENRKTTKLRKWDRKHESEIRHRMVLGLEELRDGAEHAASSGWSHVSALGRRRRSSGQESKLRQRAAEILCEEFLRRGIKADIDHRYRLSIALKDLYSI